MSYVREGLNAHVNEHIDNNIKSAFTLFNPLFYFLGLSKPDQMNKLGRPKTSVLFGGAKMGTAQVKEMLGSKSHHFKFVKAEPDDNAAVSYGGATPTASAFAEDNFGTAEIFWTHIMSALKIRKHALEQAKGPDAVGSIVDEAMAPVWESFVKNINQGFWTGTLSAAQQNAQVWSNFLGLQHTIGSANYYGRVNRSVETNLNGLVIDSTADLASTVVDLRIPRMVNNGFTRRVAGTNVTGLAAKSSNGAGATCWITTSALWQELANQADGRYQIHTTGIPGKSLGGFARPIIEFDNYYITWDPYCPSGEMYGLNLDEWVVEIQSGHNFQFLGFTDKSKTEEGGGYYEWGNFSFQGRLSCRAPWLNAKVTGLTAS